MPLLLGVPLLVILTAFVGLATIALQHSASRGWLGWLIGTLGKTAAIGLSLIPGATQLTRWVAHELGGVVLSATKLTVGWLSALGAYIDRFGAQALGWPIELFRLTDWLLTVEIPKLVTALPNAVTRIVHQTVTRVVKVERTVVKFPKLSRAQVRSAVAAALGTLVVPFLPELRWIRSHFHALTAVLPHTIPLQWGRTVTGIRKRLRRLERLTAAGVAVGAVAAALAKLGVGWIRCRKVGRVGRQICGMDEGLLESLLGDAVAIFSVVSVVEFAKELRAVEDEAVTIMGKLVREWPG